MLNAVIVKRVEISPGHFLVHVRPDFQIPDFEPGQYVALGLPLEGEGDPKVVKRSYSIGSPPDEKRYLEFYIAVVLSGILTPSLGRLKVGEKLWIAPKITGKFEAHEVPSQENLILVATGTGIAPYMSMLRTPKLWTPNRKIKLLHGVRYSCDLAYQNELLAFAEKIPNFTYFPIISRDDPNWHGHKGYVQSFFERGIITSDPLMDNIFMCGNPSMIDQVTKLLEPRGFSIRNKRNPEGKLHLEKYW